MNLTASKTDLFLACAYPFRADVVVPYEDSEAARRGREAHELLARAAFSLADATVGAKISDAYTTHANSTPWVEAGFAVTPHGAEWAGARNDRGYSAPVPGAWFRGTVDLAWHDPAGDTLHVADWKTGRRENVTPAASNGQLGMSAWALQRLTGAARVVVHLWFVRYEPDASPAIAWDGEDSAELAAMDLDGLAHTVRTRLATVETSEPTPGPHCHGMFCPLRATCPVLRAEATALATRTDLDVVDAASAARVAAMLPAAEELLRATRERLNAYAIEHGPIDLGNGYEYRASDSTRRTVADDDAAAKLVRPEALVRKVNQRRLTRDEWAALEAANLVNTTRYTTGRVAHRKAES